MLWVDHLGLVRLDAEEPGVKRANVAIQKVRIGRVCAAMERPISVVKRVHVEARGRHFGQKVPRIAEDRPELGWGVGAAGKPTAGPDESDGFGQPGWLMLGSHYDSFWAMPATEDDKRNPAPAGMLSLVEVREP